MSLEQKIKRLVSTLHRCQAMLDDMQNCSYAHTIMELDRVHVYRGIQQMAEAVGEEPLVAEFDRASTYKYVAKFTYDGVEFFQIGTSIIDCLKGVDDDVSSEV